MNRRVDRWLDARMTANNERVWAGEPPQPNPRAVDDLDWYRQLRDESDAMRGEWDAFVASGTRLPIIDDLLGGPQGSTGSWHAGVLIMRGRPADPLAAHFPRTVAALQRIPGITGAMLSVLGPGTEHPTHWGCNAGALRFLWGLDCPPGAGLEIEGTEIGLVDGEGVLFDDTKAHASWNRGDRDRALILCDLVRPLPLSLAVPNRAFQFAFYWLRDDYRGAVSNGLHWNEVLNGRCPVPSTPD